MNGYTPENIEDAIDSEPSLAFLLPPLGQTTFEDDPDYRLQENAKEKVGGAICSTYAVFDWPRAYLPFLSFPSRSFGSG